jgi:multidrug transporter EmrE-like cation transporter
MRPGLLLLILLSVSMSAGAQLCLKLGVQKVPVGGGASVVLAYLSSPFVIGGLALYGLGAFVWLFVLSRVELSAAYPFVGLGFIMTMLIGVFALGENVTSTRIAGTLLIAVGCLCVARSVA